MTKKKKASEGFVISGGTRAADVVFLFFVLLLALAILFPLYWMFSGTFKSTTLAMKIPPEIWPMTPTMANLQKLFSPTVSVSILGLSFNIPTVLRWIWNSFFTSGMTAFLVCITGAMAGYSLAKKRFPFRQAIFWMFIAVLALPRQVLTIPLFMMVRDLGWRNTYMGLIVPLIGWPFGIFLMKQFAQTLPDEVLEAAKIDGCGEVQTFLRIVIPLLKPAVGALAIFTFMQTWNDYFWQTIILSQTPMLTVQLGAETLQRNEFLRDFGLALAAASVATLPMLIVFLSFQKFFARGLTMGAVKG